MLKTEVTRFALLLVLAGAPCLAHDVSVDVSANGTAPSPDNPRTGSLGFGLSGSYDFNDAWSLMGLAVFTRDFATRTPEASSPGSNVLLFSLGAMWIPSDHLMTMLTVSASPQVDQANVICEGCGQTKRAAFRPPFAVLACREAYSPAASRGAAASAAFCLASRSSPVV